MSAASCSREDRPGTIKFCGQEIEVNKREVICSDENIEDLTPVMGLSKLKLLDLTDTRVKDLSPIKELSNLKVLKLNHTLVRDLTPLQELSDLETLWIADTRVKDLTPLQHLRNLKLLDLRDTQFKQDQLDAVQKALPELKVVQTAHLY
jgi:Leucine-rich repeat (LRR) protein